MPTQPQPDPSRRVYRLMLLGAALMAIFLSSGLAAFALRHRASTGPLRARLHRSNRIDRGTMSSAHDLALTLQLSHFGPRFAPGDIGLSIESDELATQDLDPSHKSLVALMRHLGPAVLRVGGNSLDYSWWTATTDTQPPKWATNIVTPADLYRLRALLTATGWRVILGIDLGHFDPTRAASEARIAQHILGYRLMGFEVGNDPNDFGEPLLNLRPPSYSVSNYLNELGAYIAAIRASTPVIRLYGPDVGTLPSPEWQSAAAGQSTPFAGITQHYYPTKYSVTKGLCKATSVPTGIELLSAPIREQESEVSQNLAAIGRISHREVRISETNDTASCDTDGGPATSPVFASALWSLDWVLRASSAGVSGLNFHGYLGRCGADTFSPICAPESGPGARSQVAARPEYYGLLAAKQLEGGNFIPVHVSNSPFSSYMTAYATIHPHHTIILALDDLSTEDSASLRISVPGYSIAASELLTAPSISATSDVSLGSASVDVAGDLKPTATSVSKTQRLFRLQLTPASAAIVTFRR
jgi:hypothetical protein